MNQKSKAKKVILITVLSVAAALILLFVALRFLPGKSVEVTPVSDIRLMWEPDSTTFNGAIASESYQAVYYSKERPVEKILVSEGDHVKIGDPLYQYDATSDKLNLELKQSQIEKLQYEIEDARKEYKKYAKKEFESTLPTPSPEPQEETVKTSNIMSAQSLGPVLLSMKKGAVRFEPDGSYSDEIPFFSGNTIADWLNSGSAKPNEYEWDNDIIYWRIFIGCEPANHSEYVFNAKKDESGLPEFLNNWDGQKFQYVFEKNSGLTSPIQGVTVPGIRKTFFEDVLNAAKEQSPNLVEVHFIGEDSDMGEVAFYVTYSEGGDEPIPDPINGGGMTKEERLEKVQEIAKKIRDAEVERKQLQLDVQKLLLEGLDGYVRAEINGVVAGLKDPEDIKDGDVLMAVKGSGGYYVRCTVDENRLSKVPEGTKLSGMVYETGVSCNGTVQDVSLVPLSYEENSYEYGMSATSSYEMRIKLEDDDKLTPGQYAEFSLESDSKRGNGLYIEEAYVRSEEGKNYVMVARNGILKKVEIKTGKNYYGYVEVLGNDITSKDSLAFPYGKNAMEGAKVKTGD